VIQDLHAHTYYSFCGNDSPEQLIETAIKGGIEVLGICDHNYGVANERIDTFCQRKDKRIKDYQRSFIRYLDHMRLVAKQYDGQIKIWNGIELSTLKTNPHWPLPDEIDASIFDYCLIESVDSNDTVATDMFAYAKRCNCKNVGIAHTNLPAFIERTGQDMLSFFSRMAAENIFWEINVNYDSIHNYREHAYVQRVFQDENLQQILRDSNVKLSVGFDSHKTVEYAADRIKDACNRLTELHLPLVEFDL
jgi:histidinol phosphatase-like PHP family hydrolase